MFIEVKKGYTIIVYATRNWSKDLSKSLFASTQMTKKQQSFLTDIGLTYHQVEDKHANGFCKTLYKYNIKHDVINTL